MTNKVLNSVLRMLRFKADVFFHSSFCGSWTLDTSGTGRSTFHLVTDGNCLLYMPDQLDAIVLNAGDLIVFPRDAKHTLTDMENISGTALPESEQCETNIPATGFICGYFYFDNAQRSPIVNALPDCILVKGNGEQADPRLQTLIHLMKSETDEEITGLDVVIDKLSEILFIYVVRSFINTETPGKGILAALSDTHLSRALKAIHDQPQQQWTVGRLAKQACMSRSAFSKRFSEAMDQSPMTYVTEWRMQLAYTSLKEGKKSMLDIACSIGYSSEVAFRKAFKQVTGLTPGTVRKALKLTNTV